MYRKTYHRGTFKSLATLAMLHHRVADSQDVGTQDVAVGTEEREQTEKSHSPVLDGRVSDDTPLVDYLSQFAQEMLKIFSSARETIIDRKDSSCTELLTSEDESESESDESESSADADDLSEDSHVTQPESWSILELEEWAKKQDDETKIKKNLKPLIKELKGFFVDDDTMLMVFNKLDLLHSFQTEHHALVGNILAEKCTDDILQCLTNLLNYDSANGVKNNLVKLILSILMNFTDSSEEFGKEIAEHDGIAMMTEMLKKSFLKKQKSPEMKEFIPRGSLTILHNLARDPSLKRKFNKAQTAKFVLPWLDSKAEFNCMVAVLILAHIGYSKSKKNPGGKEMEERGFVDEHDASSDIDTSKQEGPDTVISIVIEKCVAWLTVGLKTKDRRFQGFSVWDLTLGLAKLAESDANKSKIIAEGALPALLKVLQFTDHKEQLSALECLGTLSFDDTARKSIEQVPDLVSALKKLTESSNTEIKKNALGVLWQIKEGNASTSKSDLEAEKPQEFEYDVFISYCHKQKDLVHKIYTSLKNANLNVWLDHYNMKGSIFDSMSQAVKTSAVVLICMSADYQSSANCRREAELTAKKLRTFIPLIVQPKYKPDDWLDVVIGGELWIDFAGQQSFEMSMMKLLGDLKDKISSSKKVSDGRPRSATGSHTAPDHFQPRISKASPMTPADVLKFLQSKGLSNIPHELATIDGKVLGKLKELNDQGPYA